MASRTDKDKQLYQSAGKAAAGLPPLLMEAERVAATLFAGLHGRRQAGTGETFWQFREYNTTDEARRIDWKQSAKSDRTYIRETEWEAAQTLLVDCAHHEGMNYASHKPLPSKLERAQILTMAIAILAARAGEKVGILGEHQTGHSQKHLARMAAHLSNPATKDTLDTAQIPHNARILLASDFLAPLDTLENQLKVYAARRISGIILQILDPYEYQLHYFGHIRFQDKASGQSVLIRQAEKIQETYNERIETHIHALSDMTAHYGWKHVLHITDKDEAPALQDLWQPLSTRHVMGGY